MPVKTGGGVMMSTVNPAMKTSIILMTVACLAMLRSDAAPIAATGASDKVGVYDSRAIAFAYFYSPAVRAGREQLVKEAREAKAANDRAKAKALERRLSAAQRDVHLAIFSTAPATAAMSNLNDRLPALHRELGVSRFVSKWDADALRGIPVANRVDVTDHLVRQFITPDGKQQKSLEKLKTTRPLALWKAKLMLLFGGA